MAKSKRSGDAVGNAIENSLKLHQKGYWAKPVAAYKGEYVCVCIVPLHLKQLGD